MGHITPSRGDHHKRPLPKVGFDAGVSFDHHRSKHLLTTHSVAFMVRALLHQSVFEGSPMRVRNSLKSAKVRDKNCRIVRRKGRVFIINKKNPRFKVRQG